MKQEEKVLRYLYDVAKHKDGIGATCHEIEDALDLRHQSVSARLTELRRKGRIEPIAKRRAPSGRMAIAWGIPAKDWLLRRYHEVLVDVHQSLKASNYPRSHPLYKQVEDVLTLTMGG